MVGLTQKHQQSKVDEICAQTADDWNTSVDSVKTTLQKFLKRGKIISGFVNDTCKLDGDDLRRRNYMGKYFRPSNQEVATEFHHQLNDLKLNDFLDNGKWNEWDSLAFRQWSASAPQQLLRGHKGVGTQILPPRSLNFEKVIKEMAKDNNAKPSFAQKLRMETLCGRLFSAGIDAVSRGLVYLTLLSFHIVTIAFGIRGFWK